MECWNNAQKRKDLFLNPIFQCCIIPYIFDSFKGKKMFQKLEEVERRYETLSHLLGQPELIAKQDEFQKAAKECAELGKVVDLYRRLKKLEEEIQESQ